MKKTTLFLLSGALALQACKTSETKMKIEGSEAKVKGPDTKVVGDGPMATEVATKEFPSPLKQPKLDYPETRKTDQTDDYFGTKVNDPYRWLEDQYSDETAKWVEAENKVTFGYLEQIPFRNKIKDRLTQLWNYEKVSAPFKKGNNYFFYKNDGLQNQAILYKKASLNGAEEVFLDPNKLSADGTTSLSGTSFSKDAKYMAYGTSGGGSDWNTWYVMDVATKKQLTDKLEWVKFSGAAWQKDGFYYSRYDAPKDKALSNKNEFHKIYFHKIGTPQSADKLIYEDKTKPLLNFGAQTTEDERFLIINGSEGTSGGTLAYKDLKDPKGKINWLITTYESEYNVLDNVGDKLLIHTNKNAPNYKVVLMDPKKPQEANWKTIIPESQNVMSGVTMVGGKIVVTYLKDAASQVIVYDVNGKKLNELQFPAIGTVSGFAGDKDDTETFYTFTSFTYPTTVYRYDIASNKSELYWKPQIDVNPEAYETKQVFYTSKDGTKVPMFIVHKKYHTEIKAQMQRWKDNPEVEGLLFKYLHFYGTYDYLGDSRKWYRNEIRIIRNDKQIRSYKDAQGFRKNDKKLKVKPIEAYVYHYGYVKHPADMKKKEWDMNRHWHDDSWIKENVQETEFYGVFYEGETGDFHSFRDWHTQRCRENHKLAALLLFLVKTLPF